MPDTSNKGHIFVLSAPSGAGKTTLVRLLLEVDKSLLESVSHTTRAMREGEIDGVDYHFVSKDEFQSMIDADGFVESFEVFDNMYGTSKNAINNILNQGKNAILILDTKGALHMKDLYKEQLTTIFILPSSLEELQARLDARATDSKEVIARRLKEAQTEIAQAPLFDHQIVNRTLSFALHQIREVIDATK